MSHNWFLVENNIWTARHKELIRAAEQERLAHQSGRRWRPPFYAKALSGLGYHLVIAGTWLQHRFDVMLDYNALEVNKQV